MDEKIWLLGEVSRERLRLFVSRCDLRLPHFRFIFDRPHASQQRRGGGGEEEREEEQEPCLDYRTIIKE
jgi:hypothetical protein